MELCNERKESYCGLSLIKNETIEEMKPTKIKNLKKREKKNMVSLPLVLSPKSFSFDNIQQDDFTSYLTYRFGESVWNIQDYFSGKLDINS